jgi:Kef-type K+ transport system membrane component KefB
MTHLTLSDFLALLLSTGALLLLSRMFLLGAKGLGLPSVLLEILLGILIGPTILATAFPDVSAALFPMVGPSGECLKQICHFAVMALLFVAGMEIDLQYLYQELPKAVLLAVGSMALPFVAGFLLVIFNPAMFYATPDQHILLACFLGVAFSISALPVIVRILMDLGLYHSKMGLLTVVTASVMDIAGWVCFALILGKVRHLSLVDIPAIVSSHAVFLSLLAGIACGNIPSLPVNLKQRLHQFVLSCFAPLFFISIGVQVNFATHWNLFLIVTVVVVATVSKLSGTFIAGKHIGLDSRKALSIGLALNVRGAMEIILCQQAFEAGLMQIDVFVALVIMALLTSVASAPLLKWINRVEDVEQSPEVLHPNTITLQPVKAVRSKILH